MVRTAKRPFWLHQIAEYAIGAALIGSGLQSPTPAVPAVVGGLVILNAASADGPLRAFGKVARPRHRILDVVLVLGAIGSLILPGVDLGTRIVQACCIGVWVTVIVNSDYTPRRPTPGSSESLDQGTSRSAGRPDELGRRAGRVAGSLVARARVAWKATREARSR